MTRVAFISDFSNIKAIFLDVGNTLLAPHPSVEHVCSSVLAKRGYTVDKADLVEGLRLADEAYEERYWKDDSFWTKEVDTGEFWTRLYELMLRHVGLDGDAYDVGAEIYLEFGKGQAWRPFADVIPAMERLAAGGYKMGIISNWDTRLSNLAVETGLSPFLDFVISSACVGMLKPQPGIFALALGRAGVGATQALHVGDHYYADVMGARGAGITPVLLDRKRATQQADCLLIRELGELASLLGA